MATNQPDAPYGWELATDANGNQKLVPAKTPPTSGKSFYDDVTGLAEETLMPRWSDFNNVRQNAWNAGAGMASQGYNEMQASSSPEGHWGSAAKMIAGAGQATLSPLAGAYYALIGAPAGRIGPGFEHAADVASLFTPGDLVALAKARAATALPASMAEHAGPANTNISSAASQAKVDQVAREAVADESATRAAAPSAAAPTAPAQSSPGFFSGLFKDPYAGMSPEQMNKTAHEMQGAGDEYGANLLTQRVDNAITSPDGSFAQGGSVDENHPVVQRAMHLVRSFLLNG